MLSVGTRLQVFVRIGEVVGDFPHISARLSHTYQRPNQMCSLNIQHRGLVMQPIQTDLLHDIGDKVLFCIEEAA